MKFLNLNIKSIICGMALLIYGLIIAIATQSNESAVSYVVGGFGLFFVIIGCFVKDDEKVNKPEEEQPQIKNEQTE